MQAELQKYVVEAVREALAAQGLPASATPAGPTAGDEPWDGFDWDEFPDVFDEPEEFESVSLQVSGRRPEDATAVKKKKKRNVWNKVFKPILRAVVEVVKEVAKESAKKGSKLPPGPVGPRPGGRN
ncbi:MAG: hypothetical protein K2V38_26265 [Gemmataceae bacterium]|nr:hypothetical protein [Gemmataceae bacterium]